MSRKPQDKTFKIGRASHGERKGAIQFWSPPSGVTWGRQFGLSVYDRFELGQAQVLVTTDQARVLAAELLRRADELDSRDAPDFVEPR